MLLKSQKTTDIRIHDVSIGYQEYLYRTPMKFGGRVVDRATLLNVNCKVCTAGGQVVAGFGSMPLSNIWAFPSQTVPENSTFAAMKALSEEMQHILQNYNQLGHPIEMAWDLDPLYLTAAQDVSVRLRLAEPIPKLCTLVTASAFDAAIHDAYGKAHGVNCYHTYCRDFMNYDLSHYLGPDYSGEYPSDYIFEEPRPRMPLYHLVSAVDPIEPGDITNPLNDGLPESLPDWINYNGLTHLKVKLNGDDQKWDVERILTVDRVASETQRKRGVDNWFYSLDFNEKCPYLGYLIEVLQEVKQKTVNGFDRIQYVEQPMGRDLEAHPDDVVFEAAKLKPVVIDESLTDVESLFLARKMGYTGAALKACKGQSHSMILASVAEKHRMFLCVQDLTCPGASLIQSASLAAHVPSAEAIEANARQYVPAANLEWEDRFAGIFRIQDGTMDTTQLNKPGIGAV